MRLTEFIIEKLGPFYHRVSLPIDENVTILTGANDAGKSSVLKLLQHFYDKTAVQEHQVNEDFHHECQGGWQKNSQIGGWGIFSITEESCSLHPNMRTYREQGHYCEVRWSAAPDVDKRTCVIRNRSGGQVTRLDLGNFPKCFFLGDGGELRDVIELENPTGLERHFLDVAFAKGFNIETWKGIQREPRRGAMLQVAEERINDYIKQFLPTASSLQFRLQPLSSDPNKISVSLRDLNGGLTPFSSRGAGARRMLTLLAEVLRVRLLNRPSVLLLDEPETSLHADAQHLLREFLFRIASDFSIQVIYSTHSPAMINPMRPECIRLLRRQRIEGMATSAIVPRPTAANFRAVRACLGISAVDSLLFAPVTVVVEGETEGSVLPMLFEKAASHAPDKFLDFRKLLSLSLFLEARGRSWEYFVEVANTHGSRVVLFLDGDMECEVQRTRFRDKNPNIPVVLIDQGRELEDLVPRPVYFRAVAKVLDRAESDVTQEAFDQWVSSHTYTCSFSGKVKLWLREAFQIQRFSKPEIMRVAADMVKAEEIDSVPLERLIKAIDQQLRNTSFV